jgi:flagellar basal body-associated protein FliL
MVKTVGIIVAAVLAGAGVTYVLVSPVAPVAAETEDHGGHGHAAPTEEVTPESVEVPIDTFNVSNRNALPGALIHLRFKLVAAVPAGQEAAFESAANGTMAARVRQAVLTVARNASMEDMRDAELSVLKRQIKEEVNKVLRKSLVSEVIISEFRTMEQ